MLELHLYYYYCEVIMLCIQISEIWALGSFFKNIRSCDFQMMQNITADERPTRCVQASKSVDLQTSKALVADNV